MAGNMHAPPKPRALRSQRDDYRVFHAIATRWADNDAYGHVNNVVYYSWFDTAVNAWLISTGSLDLESSAAIGLVVDTACSYFESVSFPATVEIGMCVKTLGRSSVTYGIGVFRHGPHGEAIAGQNRHTAIAQGHFTHVYVDRSTRKPVPIPDQIRTRLMAIQR